MAKLPEVNILLLGETGVGKSTWLNSFYNYLSYPSLFLAKSSTGPVLHVIPTKFTITTADFEEVVVQVGGPSLEENLKTGESATQTAQIHTFTTATNIINFIDTPGIGDSRGIIKDGENMENVMKVITPLGKLHGICILLKPNEARLTLSFRFCIQELLGHLHKDAISNVVFCFTNTRGNFYRPGESIKSLKHLVNNNLPGRSSASLVLGAGTIFCFDSEAFRYLAAFKQNGGAQFESEDEADFDQSWMKSNSEAMRMIERIMSIPPHNLGTTLDLFRLRRCIDAITIPAVELKQKLKLEINNLEKAQEDTKLQQETTTASMSNVITRSKVLKREKLNHINIVCTHSDCYSPWGEGSQKERHFVKICHPNCTCLNNGGSTSSSFEFNTQNESQLLKCKELSSGLNCNVCNHPWQIHIGIDYATQIVTEQKLSTTGAADLLVNFGITLWKRSETAGIKRRVTELKEELQTIQSVTSTLVGILQDNAIDDVNDAVEEYMDHLIKNAKVGNNKKDKFELSALEELRESYGIKKEAFNTLLETSGCNSNAGSDMDMNEVDNLLDSLVALKLTGNYFRKKLNDLVCDRIGGKNWPENEIQGKTENECNIC